MSAAPITVGDRVVVRRGGVRYRGREGTVLNVVVRPWGKTDVLIEFADRAMPDAAWYAPSSLRRVTESTADALGSSQTRD